MIYTKLECRCQKVENNAHSNILTFSRKTSCLVQLSLFAKINFFRIIHSVLFFSANSGFYIFFVLKNLKMVLKSVSVFRIFWVTKFSSQKLYLLSHFSFI